MFLSNIRFKYWLLAICCVCVAQLSAQPSIDIDAPKQVSLSEPYFQIKYTVNTADDTDFKEPQTNDFQYLSRRPGKSVVVTGININGKQQSTRTTTYTLTLAPKKKGNFKLPPATIIINGSKRFESASVSIQVVEGNSTSQQGNSSTGTRAKSQASQGISNNALYVKVIPNRTEVYQHEPILLTYKFYANGNFNLSNIAPESKPDFGGLISQEIPIPEIQKEMERVGGVPYVTGTVLQYLVFPNDSNLVKIPGMTFDCYVSQDAILSDPLDLFFNGGGMMGSILKRKTSDIQIKVKPLPLPQPDNFRGAVGRFEMDGNLLTKDVKSNEICTYKVTLRGTGNLKMISAPEIQLPNGFDSYSPKVSDKVTTTTKGIEGEVTYEYTFVPRSPGEYTIPSIQLTYFDLDSHTYKTLETDEIHLNVKKGEKSDEDYLYEKDLLNADIRDIHTDDIGKKSFIHTSSWKAIITAYVFLLLIYYLVKYLLSQYFAAMADTQGRRRSKAGRMAVKRMRQAERLMRAGDERGFYAEVIRALYGYLSDKYSVGMSTLNRTYIMELLDNVDDDCKLNFVSVLDDCEIAQYAGTLQNTSAAQIYERAIDAIVSIEENSKKK